MIRFEDLIEKVRAANPEADTELLRRAYVFSAYEHKGQVRRSGEPYLVHPLEVADVLADLRLDVVAIAAGLLHDIVEDTPTTIERVRELFGEQVAHVVEGVTKPGRLAVFVNRGTPGRELPQDAARDGGRCARHPRQAGRPAPQHADAASPARRAAPANRARDARHLRAHRAPARHEQAQERARGAGLQAPRTPGLPAPEGRGRRQAQGE